MEIVGRVEEAEAVEAVEEAEPPVPPGFREMASRHRRMEESRLRMIGELAAERRAAGLSQTEIAARMGTSQSAVARLESGASDVRASTLERYAAAVGFDIAWTGTLIPPSGTHSPAGLEPGPEGAVKER
jgi:ribosome-binding protein aMBF1 (putative translation factor)